MSSFMHYAYKIRAEVYEHLSHIWVICNVDGTTAVTLLPERVEWAL